METAFIRPKESHMAYVVTQPCQGCKYTDCVVVCPCECFYEGDDMLYIDPVDCIDCGACVPECPVSAIYQDIDVPEQWTSYIALNAERVKQCAPIREKKEPAPTSPSHNSPTPSPDRPPP
jgi:ferredoxin